GDVVIASPEQVARASADSALVRAAADMLARARTPAIYAGVGVHRAGAHVELLRLAEVLDAPVFTTAQGKGAIPEDHPLAVGNRWTGEPELIRMLADSDVLLGVGTRFGATDTGAWRLPLPAAIIHIDADADRSDATFP